MVRSRIITGPLRRSKANPRYFEDQHGKAVLLSGSHTWDNFQHLIAKYDEPNDYQDFLDMLVAHNHNFTRMWQWDHPYMFPWTTDEVFADPMPFERTGPGLANDGKPKFNLDVWNEAYFERLRDHVERADQCGIYVMLMMFEGYSTRFSFPEADSWFYHPYQNNNNVNGIDGDGDGDGKANIYSLEIPAVVEYQKKYVRKVLDTLNDLDNVFYEIINEVAPSDASEEWHCHMVEYIEAYERTKPKRHPVGRSVYGQEEDVNVLLGGPGDWIAPPQGPNKEFMYDPPVADGTKVILSDTDHLWGHGGDYVWAWKTFLRGMNPVFMDPWNPIPGRMKPGYPDLTLNRRNHPDYEPLRVNLGYILEYSRRIDLNRAVPLPELASSRYCLATPGEAYLVFLPEGGTAEVDLSAAVEGECFRVEWFDPATARVIKQAAVPGGGSIKLQCPFANAGVALLYKQLQ